MKPLTHSLLSTFVLLSGLAFAQEYRATILGQVTDTSKSVIPKATVKATKQDTNLSKETITNEQGIYTLPSLDPGVYTVTVGSSGFQTTRRTDIVLQVAEKLNLNVVLEVGQITQEVTVVGEQELVQTASASRGLVFDPIKVQELPLNGRQSYMLMRFSPGVTFDQRQFGSSGFSGTRAWDVNGSFTINGGRNGSNQFLLDGAPISTDGTFNLAPNVEAIQEFKVMVNTYDSQYARTGGGTVNTTLKSGTNDWHGSLFDFWRNRVLDANARQNNASGQKRGFRNQHQFGGVIGGPIRRDKDFIMFSFEGFRELTPFPSVTSVPPMEIREGDFSKFIPQGQTSTIKVFDPMTSRPCTLPGTNCTSGGVYIRDQFPGNIIPKSRQSVVGQNIIKYYPAPNFTPQALSQNYVRGDNLGKYRYEQPIVKWDHVISDKHRFNTSYTWQDGSEFRNQNGFDPPARNGNMTGTVRRDQVWKFAYDWLQSPRRIVHWQASYDRFIQNFPDDSSGGEFTFDKLGIKSIPAVPTYPNRRAPRVQVSGYNEIFGNQYLNQSSRQQLNSQLYAAETRGRHSIKYGAEYAKVIRHNKSAGRSSGLFNFDTIWSRQHQGRRLAGVLDGASVADLLMGDLNSGYVDFNDSFLRREPYWGFYFQDDWKVNSKLTLNIGLRYDWQVGLVESHNRLVAGFNYDQVNQDLTSKVLPVWQKLAAADPTFPKPPSVIKGGLQFAGVNGVPRNIYNTDWTNIQPRIGAAYQFLPKTVMRGGFGIFHRTATQGSQTTGFSIQTPYIRSADGDLTPRPSTGNYSLENPWPDGLIQPNGSKLGINTNIGGGVSFDNRNRPIPRTYQWSYTLERELPWSMVLEASYVGSWTTHETKTIQLSDMGQADYEAAYRTPTFYQTAVTNPWYGILPANQPLGASPTISRQNLLRRIPQFNSVQSAINPWGAVYYHGLQTRFEKRMMGARSKGGALTWVLAYTWSKQMETTNRQQYNFEWFKNFVDSVITSADRSHNFQFVGIWDVPVGKGRAFGANLGKAGQAILGGWNTNWTLGFMSGVPLGAWEGWKYLCGDPRQVERTETQWFDRRSSCYTQNQPFEPTQLMSRFHQLRGHTAWQSDLAIAKKFSITERWKLELRGESFNFTNTPLRGDPPSTNPGAADFGVLPVQQLNFPRNIQIGARVSF
ncbi:MAG: carboxypeptidase regulatory-like domain-containing protein [Candidatus Solibacter usitatus]|nr:carboxypeptidase regulatory-like domain-containing protein [Candidatus Solibacter usitatus]